jgi:hypothetical protein
MRLENDEGLPWTAATGIGWIILFAALTFGTAFFLLSLYLAVWIRSKGKSSLPLIGFILSVGLCLPDVPWLYLHINQTVADVSIDLATSFWIGSTFFLRHEIINHYRESEGWNISIGPWCTLLFSTLYINYCLNPITISDGRNTVTSLNLSSAAQSRKIAK